MAGRVLKPNMWKVWGGDVGTWPVIGATAIACAWSGYNMYRWFFLAPEVQFFDKTERSKDMLRGNHHVGERYAKGRAELAIKPDDLANCGPISQLFNPQRSFVEDA